MVDLIGTKYPYIFCILLLLVGLYGMMTGYNLIRKVLALSLFQAAVLLFFVVGGKVFGGTAPILKAGETLYDNPLPHTLMLTAIVVGVANSAVALTLIIRIYRHYGSVEEDVIHSKDIK